MYIHVVFVTSLKHCAHTLVISHFVGNYYIRCVFSFYLMVVIFNFQYQNVQYFEMYLVWYISIDMTLMPNSIYQILPCSRYKHPLV